MILLLLACTAASDVATDTAVVIDAERYRDCERAGVLDLHRDGSAQEFNLLRYDFLGLELELLEDQNADDQVDRRWTWMHEDGERIQQRRDNEGDGRVDDGWDWTWEDGLLLEERFDAGLDGQLDFSARYSWEGQRLLLEERDRSGDGEPDELCSYTHREDGDLLVREGECVAQGRVMNRPTHHFDALGRQVLQRIEFGDGERLEELALSYLESGLVDREALRIEQRGEVAESWAQRRWYDTQGRLMLVERAWSILDKEESALERAWSYSYDCPE